MTDEVIPSEEGRFVKFFDDKRGFGLVIPKPEQRLMQEEITDYPDKARLTFPRLYKEIIDESSTVFSFAMSRRELRWHMWLLENRSSIAIDIESIEYLWRDDLEGNLVLLPSSKVFQWETIDGKWSGSIIFGCKAIQDERWIRHLCTTFAIDGDLTVFRECDREKLESMLEFSDTTDVQSTSR